MLRRSFHKSAVRHTSRLDGLQLKLHAHEPRPASNSWSHLYKAHTPSMLAQRHEKVAGNRVRHPLESDSGADRVPLAEHRYYDNPASPLSAFR
ncbi:Uncharacterised protein [Vibrio cholerae]|uniref:Uncharacterized protein n=1 Tax=Vibrio cholerae TaxID=666 RepID=A0A656AQL8_VIBCL|nr:Uncharacterised protein [Vibrio cholerae]CSD27132.1 Uncharacterised protein [Vibrio cholerae]CSD29980.1 Uncharacterised protein [Vibrio cholerae]CSI17933.1 Uncharacterised protein [Vibrio cholerae]